MDSPTTKTTNTYNTHTNSACAAAGMTEQVQGDSVEYHFVTFLPSATDPSTIVELDGLKPRPVLHTAVEGEGFLQRAVQVIKTLFLGKFENPEGTDMNVLALTSGEVDSFD